MFEMSRHVTFNVWRNVRFYNYNLGAKVIRLFLWKYLFIVVKLYKLLSKKWFDFTIIKIQIPLARSRFNTKENTVQITTFSGLLISGLLTMIFTCFGSGMLVPQLDHHRCFEIIQQAHLVLISW